MVIRTGRPVTKVTGITTDASANICAVTLGLLLAICACSRSASREAPTAGAPSASSGVQADGAIRAGSSQPERLIQLEVSAYAATLAADADAIYVLTEHAAYSFAPGQPPARWNIELGTMPALTSRGFAFWLDGELRLAPKQGGASQVLARLPKPPQRLCALGDHLAWVDASLGTSVLRVLDGSEPRIVYQSEGQLEALTLLDDQAYFVERRSAQWRLGAVALTGGAPRFSALHPSRTPASLAGAGEVFYYDGPSSSIRRVTTDLTGETTIANDVICSPLAVTDRLYCAQLGLLFEVPLGGGAPRPLAKKRPGTVAGLVATPTRVAWLLDVGPNRADVEVLSR